jgi:hypothetical protein
MKDAYEKYEEEQDEAEEDYDDDASETDDDDEDYEEEDDDEDCEEEYEEDDEEDEEAEDEDANEVVVYASNALENEVIEVDANEVDANEVYEEESEDENEFGCPGCNYEWRDGYKNGWKDAMKYIASKTHKEVPRTPACSYCDIVCKTRKCGGKCGGTARYCSIDCQKQDWALGHKAKCGK